MTLSANTSIRFLKGVGEKRAALFAKLGVETVRDLLCDYPKHYEDWRPLPSIRDANVGQICCLRGTIATAPSVVRIRANLTLYSFRVRDDSAMLTVTLFNNPYLADRLRPGQEYLLYGLVSSKGSRLEMSAPQMQPADTVRTIRPIYSQTAKLSSRIIENTIAQALPEQDNYLSADPLSPAIRRQYALCTRRYALENIHFPADQHALELARQRLVFEELLVLQLGLLRLRGRSRSKTAASMTADDTEAFWQSLPFCPTGAQKRAAAECVADMAKGVPMNRLIQGDVGSGKTAVAAAAAYHAIHNGWQVALMVPTEILAEQHYQSFCKLFDGFPIRVGLLRGSMTAAKRRPVLEGLQDESVNLVIGTHALLSDQVQFAKLGLVITDEQHRFGVAQRATLAAKGREPHLLVMSATPIPRTLALMVYGDLDVSVLDELPPGRQPIKTYAVTHKMLERVFGYIRKRVAEGHQAYFLCPLVEDGETDLASATAYYEKLRNGPLSGISVGLLHGRMKAADKEAVMHAFSRNEISVLVSTTVIEVGVDVPNANLMVIENAERFGLAQLHQLRGRVGRGTCASDCVLISDAQNEEAVRRLRILCETTDGFRVADEDLKLRGPGDFFGNRQHGLPNLKIADLGGDMPLFHTTQQAAKELLADDPDLTNPENQPLQEEIRQLFASVSEQSLN